MKKFIAQTVILVLLIGAGIFFFVPSKNSGTTPEIPFLPQTAQFKEIQIGEAKIKAEIADTASKRSKGLGGKVSLGENEGMLFIFPKLDKYPFWMKGLKFPLDFVWIKNDQVVDILENIPPPQNGQADSSLPIYSAKEEVDKVLEINGGTVKKFNIKVGDIISLK